MTLLTVPLGKAYMHLNTRQQKRDKTLTPHNTTKR